MIWSSPTGILPGVIPEKRKVSIDIENPEE